MGVDAPGWQRVHPSYENLASNNCPFNDLEILVELQNVVEPQSFISARPGY
jgi:hypothetical protein